MSVAYINTQGLTGHQRATMVEFGKTPGDNRPNPMALALERMKSDYDAPREQLVRTNDPNEYVIIAFPRSVDRRDVGWLWKRLVVDRLEISDHDIFCHLSTLALWTPDSVNSAVSVSKNQVSTFRRFFGSYFEPLMALGDQLIRSSDHLMAYSQDLLMVRYTPHSRLDYPAVCEGRVDSHQTRIDREESTPA